MRVKFWPFTLIFCVEKFPWKDNNSDLVVCRVIELWNSSSETCDPKKSERAHKIWNAIQRKEKREIHTYVSRIHFSFSDPVSNALHCPIPLHFPHLLSIPCIPISCQGKLIFHFFLLNNRIDALYLSILGSWVASTMSFMYFSFSVLSDLWSFSFCCLSV